MFSWEERVEITDFEDSQNINLKTIPQPILEIYKQIYNNYLKNIKNCEAR